MDADGDFSLLQGAMRDHQANVRAATLATLQFKDDPLGSGSIANMSPDASAERLRSARVPARVSASWVDGVTAQGALDRYAALPDVPMEVFIDATGHSGGLAADPFHEQPFQAASLGAPEQVAADVAFVQRVFSGQRIGRSVNYYVLGANVWKQTAQFPPAGVRSHTLRLSRSHLVSTTPRERGERLYRVDPTTSTGFGSVVARGARRQVQERLSRSCRLHPNLHALRFERPELRDQRDICGVATVCDRDAPTSRLILCGVERVPATVDERLEPRVEIHGVETVEVADDHPRRNMQRATHRKTDVRKIAAHASAVTNGVGRGRRASTNPVAILDV